MGRKADRPANAWNSQRLKQVYTLNHTASASGRHSKRRPCQGGSYSGLRILSRRRFDIRMGFLMGSNRRAVAVKVTAAFDPEAGVYYIVNSNVWGLRTEAETLDDLMAKVLERIPALLESNAA